MYLKELSHFIQWWNLLSSIPCKRIICEWTVNKKHWIRKQWIRKQWIMKFVRTSTEIALQHFLRNISQTFRFDNKMKTKFNHKKFTCLVNPSRKPRLRGQVNFLGLNLVFILLSKWKVLQMFCKKCWSAMFCWCLHKFYVFCQTWPQMAVLARKGEKKRAAFPSGGPPLEKETNAGHFIQQKIF